MQRPGDRHELSIEPYDATFCLLSHWTTKVYDTQTRNATVYSINVDPRRQNAQR